MEFTGYIEDVCKDKVNLIFAVPSMFVRSTAWKVSEYVPAGQIFVDVVKGIKPDTLMTMSEIISSEVP